MSNSTLKICTVLGARPQFVKAAAVSRAIKCLNKNSQQDVITETIIHTGQHYDDRMSEVFFFENLASPVQHLTLELAMKNMV